MHVRMRSRFLAAAAAALAVALVATGCSAADSGSAESPVPADQVPGLDPGTGVGREVDPQNQPQSTFGIDIDTASYNFARRQILDGRTPDPALIRPEEFINAFKQDFAPPVGDGFSVAADGARLPSQHKVAAAQDSRIVRVGLQTRGEDRTQRRNVALTLVVDVSGSMSEPGRLDLVQDGLHFLVDQLRDDDAVAIVAYDHEATVLREMTPVRSRSTLHAAIDRLETRGGTNLEAGLVTGYQVARQGFVPDATNRVVLMSDGLANVGETSAAPILEQIREQAAKQISLLGVGVGSSYGDQLMERLADQGDGFVTYVSERDQARRLFVDQLPATLAIRARDAKVQVTFDPATVASYRLIGYENRTLAASQFRDDRVDGGEVGPGHSVTALYLVHLRDGRSGQVAEARVRWLGPSGGEAQEKAVTIRVADLDGSFAGASPRLRTCYAAAYFAESLRHSRYAEEIRLADLAGIAQEAFRATEDPQVDELVDLIRRAG